MESTIRLRLGYKIKSLRKKQKLTQEQLSETSGVDYKYLQRIEGKNPPALKIDTIERIAKAIKVTPADLL
jgi:transcriptional regulator with XRE-family HTH domain